MSKAERRAKTGRATAAKRRGVSTRGRSTRATKKKAAPRKGPAPATVAIPMAGPKPIAKPVRHAPAPAAGSAPDRTAIEDLIHRACLCLDDGKFREFLDLCDDRFEYSIGAYSPEIRRDMVWQEQSKSGMEHIFELLPKHNSDHATLSRFATVYAVGQPSAQGKIEVVSRLQVFRTLLDGGTTELFAVGRMHDTVFADSRGPRLLKRVVKLDTRMMGMGSHVPF